MSRFDDSATSVAPAIRGLRAAQRPSAAVPLVLYLRTASGGSDWLDGGEFVAAVGRCSTSRIRPATR